MDKCLHVLRIEVRLYIKGDKLNKRANLISILIYFHYSSISLFATLPFRVAPEYTPRISLLDSGLYLPRDVNC